MLVIEAHVLVKQLTLTFFSTTRIYEIIELYCIVEADQVETTQGNQGIR